MRASHHLSVLDVEIGHLGDPMMDLAAWRQRDTIIGYGDFTVTARKWIAGSDSYLRGSGHGRVDTDGGLSTVTAVERRSWMTFCCLARAWSRRSS